MHTLIANGFNKVITLGIYSLLFLIPIVGAIYGMPPNFRTISASSEALRLDVTATVIPRKDMKQSCNL